MKPILIIVLVLNISFLFSQVKNIESPNGENIFYYPNGQISSKGYMKNGSPIGFWQAYYVTGVLKSEGNRLNGMLDSVWVFYNEEGLIKEKINYLEGKKNGYYYSFEFFKNLDSTTISYLNKEELYLNNKRNGKSIYYYKNGLIEKEIFYKNGLKDGISREYDSIGNLVTVIDYIDGREVDRDNINRYKDSIPIGVWKEFYPNGKIKREMNYTMGKLHGLLREYAINGELILSQRYEYGVIVDSLVDVEQEIKIVEEFYNKRDSSGEFIKKLSGGYVDGKPVGVHRTYDSLGRVNSSKLYDRDGNLIGSGIVDIEGDKIGDWKYFYENGNIKSEGQYWQNRRIKLWKYYYVNGNIEQNGTFTNGAPDGVWKWFYEEGNLMREENYAKGKENGESIQYNDNGKIVAQGNYIDGLKDGNWYFDFDFHVEKGNFKADNRDGQWIFYYKNGNIYFEGSFVDGIENGKHCYYYKNGQLKEKRYYVFGRKDKNWEYYDYYGSLLKILTFDNNILIKIDGISIETDND